MYAVRLRLIGKLLVDFLFVIIVNRTFSLGVTAEALRLPANIDWKSAFFERVGQFRPKLQVQGDVKHQPVR